MASTLHTCFWFCNAEVSALHSIPLQDHSTYVLKVLKALLDAVMTGTCSFGSHGRIPRCKSVSSAGDLSTIYDIQACLNPLVFFCFAQEIPLLTSPVLFVIYKSQLQGPEKLIPCSVLTDRIPCSCSPPIVFELRPGLSIQAFQSFSYMPHIRGSSSSRFSKYLLP